MLSEPTTVTKAWRWLQDLFFRSVQRLDAAPLMVMALLIALFWRNFIPGNAISKLHFVPDFDAMFGQKLSDPIVPVYFDNATLFMHCPNALYLERWVSKLVLPLWNPLNGFGEPFIGNIQAMIFSPLHFLFPASNFFAYNIGIVASIIFGAFGGFVLARILGLSAWSAALVGVSYALCPHVLRNIELPGQLFYYPWVTVLFVCLANSGRVSTALICGTVLTVVLFSMHPATFFVAVLTGVLIGLGAAIESKHSKIRTISSYLKCVFVVAAVSILLSAPVLMPFLELMRNTYLYKHEHNPVHFYPWWEFFEGLFLPYQYSKTRAFLCSPYLGLISAIFIPIGLLKITHNRKTLLVIAVVFFVLTTWLPPFDLILSRPPLSFVLCNYYLPSLIMLCALISGCGFDAVVLNSETGKYRTPFIVSVALVLLANAFAFKNWFVAYEKSSQLDGRVLLTFIPILGILLLVGISLIARRRRRDAMIFLTVLNTATLAFSVTMELRIARPFSYPPVDVTEFLRKRNSRFVAAGDRLILQNINLAYDLADARSLQVAHPTRYLKFVDAIGATYYHAQFSIFPDWYDHLLDIASVKFVPTLSAVNSKETLQSHSLVSVEQNGRIAPGLRLSKCRLTYDPTGAQVLISADWEVHESAKNRYLIRYHVVDSQKRIIWEGAWISFFDSPRAPKHIHKQYFAVPVPLNTRDSCSVALSCKAPSGNLYKPDSLNLPRIGKHAILGTFKIAPEDRTERELRHFKVVFENGLGIRIYENQRALPEAFLSYSAIGAKSEKDSFERITSSSFDPQKQVVVESNNFAGLSSLTKQPPSKYEGVVLRWLNCNEATVIARPKRPAVLVFSQLFYPGWEATVDGAPAQILQANYLFQSVLLGPGRHEIRFRYCPQSFYLSAWLSGITLIGILLTLAFLNRRSFKTTLDTPASS